MVEQFVELGARFSISGYFFRPEKSEKLATFDLVPLERLLIETDAPDMCPPQKMISHPRVDASGNEINDPANIESIYQMTANRRGMSLAELAKTVRSNFETWYGGPKSD